MAAPSLSPHVFRSWATEEAQELMLRIWEDGSAERDVICALAAVQEVLHPLLGLTSAILLRFEEGQARLAQTKMLNREAAAERAHRQWSEYTFSPLIHRQQLRYDISEIERRVRSGKPFTCPDLLAKDSWYEHEFQLAEAGVRSYASLPLAFAGKAVGFAILGRLEPGTFAAQVLLLLRHVSPAIAGVIANALEKERTIDRVTQLEKENLDLRSHVKHPRAIDDENAKATHSLDGTDAFRFLRDRMDDGNPDGGSQLTDLSTDLSVRLKEEERRLIEVTLQATRGRIAGPKGAAARLGLPSSTLEFRIRRLGIDKFQYRRPHQEQQVSSNV